MGRRPPNESFPRKRESRGGGCGDLIARPHPAWIPASAGMTHWGVAGFRNYPKSLNKIFISMTTRGAGWAVSRKSVDAGRA